MHRWVSPLPRGGVGEPASYQPTVTGAHPTTRIPLSVRDKIWKPISHTSRRSQVIIVLPLGKPHSNSNSNWLGELMKWKYQPTVIGDHFFLFIFWKQCHVTSVIPQKWFSETTIFEGWKRWPPWAAALIPTLVVPQFFAKQAKGAGKVGHNLPNKVAGKIGTFSNMFNFPPTYCVDVSCGFNEPVFFVVLLSCHKWLFYYGFE